MKVDIESGQKIATWMKDRVRRFQCPVCQHLTWNSSEDIYSLTSASGPSVRKAVVTLQCANCASLTFFDAASIGIVAG
jgi:RNase P subunit RPR2